MSQTLDLRKTFVHLRDGGSAERVAATPAFWSASAAGRRYDRVLGALDFASARDLHSSMDEMHPEADEVLLLVSGALAVVLCDGDAQRTIELGPGQAAIVPRGVWHHLVMREPGRLLFINSRTGMETRPHPTRGGHRR